MKKTALLIVILALTLALAACGGDTSGVDIDYGSSDLYSREDMDAAIALIKAEFDGWEGCELHSIAYAGDECAVEGNVRWMNDLKDAQGIEGYPFTQCIEFLSDFHSPIEGGDAWNPDQEYTGWQWWLARAEDGDWVLLTWGY